MSIGIFGAARSAGSYDLKAIFGAAAPRRLDRLSEMVLAVSGQAFADAKKRDARFGTPLEQPQSGGVFFATGQGNFSGTMAFLEKMRDKGARFANPIDFPNLVMSAGAGSLSMQFQLRGELLTLTQQRIAGLQALCFAYEALSSGRLEYALAAGAEELSAPRQRCAELLGEGNLGEGAVALVLARAVDAPVRLSAAVMMGPQARQDELLERCLRGSAHASAEIVTLPGRGESDVGGLIDAAHAFSLLAAGELSHAVCMSTGPDGACAVLLERGAE